LETKLKRERMSRKLKQIELAVRVGVHPSQYSAIESSKLAASRQARAALSRFFERPESALFDGLGRAIDAEV
jgi:transcriptional regulator with XRE-family HTH domain